MSTFVNRTKIGIFILLFLATLAFSKITFALVVSTPLIAVSILKLSVFIASAIAVPFTALINLVKKDKKRVFLISAVVLISVFVISYVVLTIIAKQSSPRADYVNNIELDRKMQDIAPETEYMYPEGGAPIDKSPHSSAPFPKETEPQTNNYGLKVMFSTGFLWLIYFVYAFGIVSVPALIGLLLIRKKHSLSWSKLKFVFVWLTLNATLAAFGASVLMVLAGVYSIGGIYLY